MTARQAFLTIEPWFGGVRWRVRHGRSIIGIGRGGPLAEAGDYAIAYMHAIGAHLPVRIIATDKSISWVCYEPDGPFGARFVTCESTAAVSSSSVNLPR